MKKFGKRLILNITYYIGLVLFVKFPKLRESLRTKWEKARDEIDNKLGEKRF
jgi:hypothetical protein